MDIHLKCENMVHIICRQNEYVDKYFRFTFALLGIARLALVYKTAVKLKINGIKRCKP